MTPESADQPASPLTVAVTGPTGDIGRSLLRVLEVSPRVGRVAAMARARGLRFGFGGIARLDDGLLPGRDVLAEHLRLGSGSVILSRTFHNGESPAGLPSLAAYACRTGSMPVTSRAGPTMRGPRVGLNGNRRTHCCTP